MATILFALIGCKPEQISCGADLDKFPKIIMFKDYTDEKNKEKIALTTFNEFRNKLRSEGEII